jgi:outer membrane lipoprotein SlyB
LGTIIDITNVTIEGDRRLGAATGAAIGGVAGKNVTESDTESDIASVIGALAGSAIGANIGSSLTKKNGVELLIETDSGRLVSIIQEVSEIRFENNQRVRIIKRNGKSRVLPIQ